MFTESPGKLGLQQQVVYILFRNIQKKHSRLSFFWHVIEYLECS